MKGNIMEKIESFKINHLVLNEGIYVSRQDSFDGVCVTTFDLRFTRPNREPVMDVPAIHTIEHLGATYLRNSSLSERVVYFGPMGCRTGFYLVVFGDISSEEIFDTVVSMCGFIEDFEGEIPGASPIECGNFSEQNLNMAKYYVKKYKDAVVRDKNFVYPEK